MSVSPRLADPRWTRWVPGIIWLTVSVLWMARWAAFPLMLDPYYHLLIAKQLIAAGGPILYEWWEYAPVGRVHLYPPVLHMLLAGVLHLGVGSITTIRLISALVMPALLLSVWLTMQRLYAARVAAACLLMACLPFTWYLQVGQALASGLAAIAVLWLVVAVVEGRVAAAACLLALLWYTHLGLPWVGVVTLIVITLGRAAARLSSAMASLGLGVLLGLPWLWHIVSHAGLLRVIGRTENQTLELMPALLACAAVGAWRCWQGTVVYRVPLALAIGFGVMAYPFTFRWLSGEGLLPLLVLAGFGLERIASWCGRRFSRLQAASWVSLLAIGALMLGTPTMAVRTGPLSGVGEAEARRIEWRWPDSALLHLVGTAAVQRKGTDIHLYGPPTEHLARMVEAISQPGDVLWSNMNYGGGLVAALAQRPTSSAMFYEVPPARPFDPIASARWIIWFRVGPLPTVEPLPRLVERLQLQFVEQTPLALVWRNPSAASLAHSPEAVIPLWLAGVLLCGLLGVVVWDFRRSVAG